MVRRYKLQGEGTAQLRVISEEEIGCPICGNELKVIGSRSRMVIDSKGRKLTIIIRRLRCKECLRLHHELPDMLVPYKRHCAQTIEKIIRGEVAGLDCEERTIKRLKGWWAGLEIYIGGIVASLEAKYGVRIEGSAPREIIRAVVNSHLWAHTRTAYAPG